MEAVECVPRSLSRAVLSSLNRRQVPTAIDHSPAAGLVVTAHTDKLLRLWDPRTSEGQVMKSTLSSHSSWVACVSWHPSSSVHVLSGSVDKTACLWDVRRPALSHRLHCVTGDCALLTIMVQVRSRFAMFTLSQHTHEVSAVDWSSDGSQFATGSKDGHVRCFKWNSNAAVNAAEASE